MEAVRHPVASVGVPFFVDEATGASAQDGTVVYESIAILLHLQRKHDSAGKLLGERADRVFRLVMESENVTRAYAPVEKLFERHALTDAQRDKARAAPAKLERELQLWERYLVDGPFIAGTTTITLADMAFFPCLAYALHRGFVLHPRRFARLTAYVAHMQGSRGNCSTALHCD